MARKITHTEFINKAKEKFGDRFDFSKTEYKGSHEKIKVICKEHGESTKNAYAFMNSKYGCAKCYNKKTVERLSYSKEDINNLLDDTIVSLIGEYDGYESRNKFSCKKHGVFYNIPHIVISSKHKCRKCAAESTSKILSKGNDNFILESKNIYGDKFSYKNTKYKNSAQKVTVTCKIHGDVMVIPNDHLNGHGCGKCAGIGLSYDDFVKKYKSIHGDKYEYIKADNKNIYYKCKTHGIIKQLKYVHGKGSGCSKCSSIKKGFSRSNFINICDDLALMYIVEMENNAEKFYKIGITSKSIDERFKNIPYNVKLIRAYIDTPSNVYDLEKKLLKKNLKNKHKPLIHFGGSTECFKMVQL
jgi:hypothetical protein